MPKKPQINRLPAEAGRIRRLRRRLLSWYDRHQRVLPWRVRSGERPDPYAVWLSEIMLQQTTVATVGAYFGKFMAKWPAVTDLAEAPLDQVLHAWQGLGYYARARNLHRCAVHVAGELGGRFPDTEAGLLALPGVGPYTAAAIAAIAFDRPAVPVDGNIERVTARLFAIDTPLPQGKADIVRRAQDFKSRTRPGDFAQAMMDLGATVCTPKSPDCRSCPLIDDCRARKLGIADSLPARRAKKARPTRRAVAFWLVDNNGQVMLRRREASGLLGGMMEFPSTPWTEGGWPDEHAVAAARPPGKDWQRLDGVVVHVFTHFRLEIAVEVARLRGKAPGDAVFALPADLADHALPTMMKKIARHALGPAGAEASPKRPRVRAEASKRPRR